MNYYVSIILSFFSFFFKNFLFFLMCIHETYLFFLKTFYFFKINTYSGYYWFLYVSKIRSIPIYKIINK